MQMKEALLVDADSQSTALDIQNQHKVSYLYSRRHWKVDLRELSPHTGACAVGRNKDPAIYWCWQ
jgi:hypothetical protein